MEILKEFETYLLTVRELKPNTAQVYVSDVTMVLEGVGKPDFRSISSGDIERLCDRLAAEKSPASIARAMSSARIFFSFLNFSGICQANPLNSIHFSYERKAQKASSAEIRKLVEASVGKSFTCVRNRAVLELLSGTKIKQTELMGLHVCDADIINGKLRIPGGKTIHLSGSALSALNDYLIYILMYKQAQPDSPLIMNAGGERMSRQGYWKIVKKTAHKAGLDENLSPVWIRRQYGSPAVMAGPPANE